ncbi:YaeQ family protein [Aliagarivorans marinus]|uniref:YaeQ family protein n=1 Tax=Aliagarivorans marinus TaxID=561965 RepID=UPI000420F0E2|nr:YaeQ family protein [Aliagarivorans marinus]
MALKPTIYKFRIHLSDLNIDHYDSLSLTIAQHPSENPERMLTRVLTACLLAQKQPEMTKGLSEIDEPDLWVRTLDQQITLWVEVGEPTFDRLKKACRSAKQVDVFSFNSKSDTWFNQSQGKFSQLPVKITQFNARDIEAFSALLTRTMDLSVTITGETAFINTESGDCEVHWQVLQDTQGQA